MGLRRRKGVDGASSVTSSKASSASSATSATGSEMGVEDVMRDNLDLMFDVVMRIREDPDFAANIYADCPRLQHLLDQHPDLRPIFEDPYLVKLNFEKVYTDSGGILPETKPPPKSFLAIIVSHPLFKVFKVLLIFKKIFNCVVGGGMSFLKGIVKGLCFDDAADLADAGDGQEDQAANRDYDDHDISQENQEAKDALNRAADHMEDPEVQERMNEILNMDDPEKIDEAIENDPELKAIRNSSPLCEELMSDPETMRILVDPDNLRALGDCPDLIEQDFANPDWSPPDVEAGGYDEFGYDGDAANIDPMEDVDVDADGADGDRDSKPARERDMEAGEEEFELEEGGDEFEFEMGDEDRGGDRNKPSKKPKGKKASKNQMRKREKNSNFMHNIGVGLTDMVAGEMKMKIQVND